MSDTPIPLPMTSLDSSEDPHGLTVAELKRLRLAVAAANLPEKARIAAERELDHLVHTPPTSNDAIRTRNWLEWMLELPWPALGVDAALRSAKPSSQRKKAVQAARTSLTSIIADLDARLCGLDEVKQQIGRASCRERV